MSNFFQVYYLCSIKKDKPPIGDLSPSSYLYIFILYSILLILFFNKSLLDEEFSCNSSRLLPKFIYFVIEFDHDIVGQYFS